MAASYSGTGTSKSLLRRMFSAEFDAENGSWLKVIVLSARAMMGAPSIDFDGEPFHHRQDSFADAEQGDLLVALVGAGAVVPGTLSVRRTVDRAAAGEEEEIHALLAEHAQVEHLAGTQPRRVAGTTPCLPQASRRRFGVGPAGAQRAQRRRELLRQSAHDRARVVSFERDQHVVQYEGENIRLALAGPRPREPEIACAVALRGVHRGGFGECALE